MSFWYWVIIFFLVMHLLVCAWVRFDAWKREINEKRWYLFSLCLPVLGIILYAITKRSWKAWMLFFSLWIFPAFVLIVAMWVQIFLKPRGQ